MLFSNTGIKVDAMFYHAKRILSKRKESKTDHAPASIISPLNRFRPFEPKDGRTASQRELRALLSRQRKLVAQAGSIGANEDNHQRIVTWLKGVWKVCDRHHTSPYGAHIAMWGFLNFVNHTRGNLTNFAWHGVAFVWIGLKMVMDQGVSAKTIVQMVMGKTSLRREKKYVKKLIRAERVVAISNNFELSPPLPHDFACILCDIVGIPTRSHTFDEIMHILRECSIRLEFYKQLPLDLAAAAIVLVASADAVNVVQAELGYSVDTLVSDMSKIYNK